MVFLDVVSVSSRMIHLKVMSVSQTSLPKGARAMHFSLYKIGKFFRDRRGAAAVEAALLVPIFVPVFVFTLETLIFLYSSVSVDYAVREAAREMKIGELTGSPKTVVCEKMLIPGCLNRIKVTLTTYDSTAKLVGTTTTFPGPGTLAMLKAELPVEPAVFMSKLFGKNITAGSAYLFQTELF